uniref:KASH domain-containing protein n=1 Tax=Oryzias latipes TaxID=8090 RepID=A0A3P9HPR5_ORYLA
MPGEEPAPFDHGGDAPPTSDDLDSEDGGNVELLLDLSQQPLLFGEKQMRGNHSQDGDLQTGGQVERRWRLWQEFMNEQAHLDAWLRSTEQAVAALSSAHFTHSSAKEELWKLERLRTEAGSWLIKLDCLTQKNRTLTRLFQGTMQARLLALVRECGQRWDEVNAKLESILGRLKLFIAEWEEFEEQREGLSLWLADMDVRLTDVDQLSGSTCKKLKLLQVSTFILVQTP